MPTVPPADVFAPDDFPALQDASVDRRYRYLDRCRRVRVGPAVTVVFENTQTSTTSSLPVLQLPEVDGRAARHQFDDR